MSDKKYQVFVSSTFEDLKEERQQAVKGISDMGNMPVGMELFPAAGDEQMTYIRRIIDNCDYYVLIIGGRYGSVDSGGVSYTEREFDYALEKGLTVLAFVHPEPAALGPDRTEADGVRLEALNRFRQKVQTGRVTKAWTRATDLQAAVVLALTQAVRDRPATGWIRGDAAANADILQEINTLRRENDELKAKLENLVEANQPKFEDLADMDDKFTVHFRCMTAAGIQNSWLKLSWREIFALVGGHFRSPAYPEAAIRRGLEGYIESNSAYSGIPQFNAADIAVVLAQFEALGLIKVFVAQSASGDSSSSYGELTDSGRKMLLEILARRKADQSAE